MRRAVYTAIAGEYDQLRDHPEVPGVDWMAFVTHPQQYEHSNWNVRPLFSYGEPDPRRQAKWYKTHSLLEMAEYDRTLWIDGSCEVLSSNIIHILLEVELPFALYKHQDRDCIYQEAGFSLGMRKYRDEPIRAQVQYYLDEYEHPEHWGLWFAGLIVRNRCPLVERIETQWWNEIERWSYQDQISLPVVMRNVGYSSGGGIDYQDHNATCSLPSVGLKGFQFHQQPESL
jgi:hypothetical protein